MRFHSRRRPAFDRVYRVELVALFALAVASDPHTGRLPIVPQQVPGWATWLGIAVMFAAPHAPAMVKGVAALFDPDGPWR